MDEAVLLADVARVFCFEVFCSRTFCVPPACAFSRPLDFTADGADAFGFALGLVAELFAADFLAGDLAAVFGDRAFEAGAAPRFGVDDALAAALGTVFRVDAPVFAARDACAVFTAGFDFFLADDFGAFAVAVILADGFATERLAEPSRLVWDDVWTLLAAVVLAWLFLACGFFAGLFFTAACSVAESLAAERLGVEPAVFESLAAGRFAAALFPTALALDVARAEIGFRLLAGAVLLEAALVAVARLGAAFSLAISVCFVPLARLGDRLGSNSSPSSNRAGDNLEASPGPHGRCGRFG